MEPGAEFPQRFGKYVLLDRIAAGGMAEVFLAKVRGIERFKRLIAIKCMRPELAVDQQFAAMFIDEANLAGQLQHANIAQIYELGRYQKQLYIAMELIEGRDLRAILTAALEQGRCLPLPFAAYVIRSAARGLDHAHRKAGPDGALLNLVHRDVSPANLLMSWEGEVKIVDFGIAKASARDSETRVGIIKGKFAYMAPEQINAQDVDRRTDIFTLGTVLYELITGDQLFRAETDFEVIDKVKWVKIPNLEEKLAGMPADLLTTLQTTLERDPAKRFQYASDLAKALEPLLIHDRSIFDAQEAAEFLAELYPEEEVVKARQANRALLEQATPVGLAPEEADDWSGSTETFHSDFALEERSDISARPAAGPEGRGSEPDFWRSPTVEMARPRGGSGLRDFVVDEEAIVQKEAEPAVEDLETIERSAAMEASGAAADPASNRTASGEVPGLRRTQERELGWLWVLGIFLVAGGLGTVLYLKQPPPEDEEEADEFDLPPDDGTSADGDTGAGQSGRDPAKGAVNDREFGYVTIKVKGGKGALVYIDGKRVGRAPLTQKVQIGTRVIKVEDRKRKNRTKVRRVSVTKKNTRKSPLNVVLKL